MCQCVEIVFHKDIYFCLKYFFIVCWGYTVYCDDPYAPLADVLSLILMKWNTAAESVMLTATDHGLCDSEKVSVPVLMKWFLWFGTDSSCGWSKTISRWSSSIGNFHFTLIVTINIKTKITNSDPVISSVLSEYNETFSQIKSVCPSIHPSPVQCNPVSSFNLIS